MRPPWYRNAVIYEVDPSMFYDANGDGHGDLRGVTDRLDHLRGLGVTCLWLRPFYVSPFRDAGYDVANHLAVDPRLGDITDFVFLLEKAEELGIKVIVELVAQHTSKDHPWFQQARRDPDSPFRDYYIWADEPHTTDVKPIFPTVEDSVWSFDESAGQYYRHVFYSHEPDLNIANPAVRDEIWKIMAYWLRLGVSGFRIDAAPYIMKSASDADSSEEGRWLLREMRDFVTLRSPQAVLLGEVDVPIEKYDDYFLGGSGATMLLDFWTNNWLFLALARQDAGPLLSALQKQPLPPRFGQYANWLRNHDELDLERLDETDRQEVLDVFAPKPSMRVYGRGLRRRLAPMLDGDENRILSAHALLLSLPGTAVLRYGDEIGMGDDLSRPERRAVRTPMQWSNDVNGGFSTASPEDLVAPVISGGPFGFERTNVYSQTLRRDSILARIGNLVRTRMGLTEIGWGVWQSIDVGCRPVLALRYDHDGSTVVTLVNLSDQHVQFSSPAEHDEQLIDVVADGQYDASNASDGTMALRPYGYRWLRPRRRLFR